ncbi:MAG: hypothetical protein WC756_21685 [Taibaiella sp.]|jgi:hypothetical protein
MPVKIAPPPRQQFENANGIPYSGAKLFTYLAGGTTKTATYTDSTGGTANANPIILDSAGRTPNGLWLTQGLAYKFVLAPSTDTDPPTSPIFTEDNVRGVNDPTDSTSYTQWVVGLNQDHLNIPAAADLATANTVLTDCSLTLSAINKDTNRIITYGFAFHSDATNIGWFDAQIRVDGLVTGNFFKSSVPAPNHTTAGRVGNYVYTVVLPVLANDTPTIDIRVRLWNDTGAAYRWDSTKVNDIEQPFIRSSL